MKMETMETVISQKFLARETVKGKTIENHRIDRIDRRLARLTVPSGSCNPQPLKRRWLGTNH
jgi:hypothetical protein